MSDDEGSHDLDPSTGRRARDKKRARPLPEVIGESRLLARLREAERLLDANVANAKNTLPSVLIGVTAEPEASPMKDEMIIDQEQPVSSPERSPTADAETTSPSAAPPKVQKRGSRIDAFRHMVGKVPDAVVAARAGVSHPAVHLYRKRHGIASAVPQGVKWGDRSLDLDEPLPPEPGEEPGRPKELLDTKAPSAPSSTSAKRRGPKSKLDPHRDVIGVLGDREVAQRAGVTVSGVQCIGASTGSRAPPPRVTGPRMVLKPHSFRIHESPREPALRCSAAPSCTVAGGTAALTWVRRRIFGGWAPGGVGRGPSLAG